MNVLHMCPYVKLCTCTIHQFDQATTDVSLCKTVVSQDHEFDAKKKTKTKQRFSMCNSHLDCQNQVSHAIR